MSDFDYLVVSFKIQFWPNCYTTNSVKTWMKIHLEEDVAAILKAIFLNFYHFIVSNLLLKMFTIHIYFLFCVTLLLPAAPMIMESEDRQKQPNINDPSI